MNKLAILASAVLLSGCCPSAVTVKSPDGNLSLTLGVDHGESSISITYKSETILDNTPVGIEFADGYFGRGVKISSQVKEHITDDYDLPAGKSSHVHSESNEIHLCLTDDSGRQVEMFLRAFNDGVAYRYFIPEQDGMKELAIRREVMDLNFPGHPLMKAMKLEKFNCSHEDYYAAEEVGSLTDNCLYDMPALLSYPEGPYMAITESNVVDYAGMDLISENGNLKGVLSPRLDASGLCVTGSLPRRSPWRVFQVSDRIGSLLESDIVTTLADPCQEQDVSWLEPGLATWPWWNCYQAPSELRKGDINTINQNINRHYIDFCAENGIPYHSITGLIKEDGNEICWFSCEDSPTGNPGVNDDTSTPYRDFDLDSVLNYAADRCVGVRVWVHWKILNKNMEETFRNYNKWGIKGMMIDYMDRDDEEMIAFQKNALELAMKYHLHVQFHGASKPSGLCRTYPCEFTRENTKNYECYKWGTEYNEEGKGSGHDLDVAFVRTMAGPADYHLGSFRAVKSEEFEPVFRRPVTTSTRAHSLAMYIALQSSLHLISDVPEAYENQTGFEFIRNVPTAWDETLVLQADLDEYLVIARRKDDKWYIGGIGNSKPRDLSIPLEFLGAGKFSQTLFCDAEDSDINPNHIEKSESSVSSDDTINIHLSPDGGFAAAFTPVH